MPSDAKARRAASKKKAALNKKGLGGAEGGSGASSINGDSTPGTPQQLISANSSSSKYCLLLPVAFHTLPCCPSFAFEYKFYVAVVQKGTRKLFQLSLICFTLLLTCEGIMTFPVHIVQMLSCLI